MDNSDLQIPEAKLEELKESVDFLSLLGSYGLEFKKQGADYFTTCPSHDDKTPSLSINPTKGVFHFFSCGENGTANQFVQKLEGLGFRDAVEKLAGCALVSLSNLPKDDIHTVPEPKTLSKEEHVGFLSSVFKRFQRHYKQSDLAQSYLLNV